MISPQVIQELLTVRQVLHYLPASPKTEKGWTQHEQQLFWDALTKFPQGPWTTIAEFIGTKSTRQAMTHGQKLRQKLNRWRKRLRRTPAAALALAEDPELLDDDVKASIALNSVVATSAAMSSAAMTMARSMPPLSAAAVSTAPATTSAASTSVSMSTMTAAAATATASSRRALYVDDIPAAPHYYSTRASSKMPVGNAGFSLNAKPTASSELSAADMNYTELLMASFPFASTGISSCASMPSSIIGTSAALDAMTASMVSAITTTPSLPLSFVSSERLVDHSHSFGYHYQQPQYQQPQHQQQQQYQLGHASQRSQPASAQTATASAVAIATPLYYTDDERYLLPQSMVDDLADVLWDC